MLIGFSDPTTALLKAHLHDDQINWLDENTLDLASIKQLKGCRTELLQDCLKFIQHLDSLVESKFFNTDKEKNYVNETIKSLIEDIKHYKTSCEQYPRIKDFLNIIPDNTSGLVGFTLVISAFIAIVFPPLAVIPLVILSWIVMDLFFNNREAAKQLKEILFAAKDELRTIQEADTILKTKQHTSQTITQTQGPPMAAIPSTSRGVGYSPSLYGSVEHGIESETSSIHSNDTDSFPLLNKALN